MEISEELELTPEEKDNLRKKWLKSKAQLYDDLVDMSAEAQLAKISPRLTEVREKLAEVEKKLDDREDDLLKAKREEKERICDYLVGLLTNQDKQAPFAISMIKILKALKEGE